MKEHTAKVLEWKRANPEKVKAHNRIYAKKYNQTIRGRANVFLQRAKFVMTKKGETTDLTVEFLMELIQTAIESGGISIYTGRPDSASMDQIIPQGGYTRDNVRIVPHWYNQAKHIFDDKSLLSAMAQYGFVRPNDL